MYVNTTRPDGTILEFKRDKSLCEGFPFIDMENLKEHAFKPSTVAGNTSESKTNPVEDLVSKLKAVSYRTREDCDTDLRYHI